MIQPKPVSEQELANTRYALSLLREQIQSGQFEREYSLNQLDRFLDLFDRLAGQVKAQRHAGRFEALYEVGRVLGSSLDQQQVLEQVMDAIIQLTGAERGLLMLQNDDGLLNVQVARNLDQKTLSSEEFRYSSSISNLVLNSGEAVLTTNAEEDPRFSAQASVVRQSLRSIMAVPMRARGKIIGIAYVENRVVAGLFNREDLATLEALVGQAAVAIDNAMLFSATDQALANRLDELRELRRIDLRLNEKLEIGQVLMVTLETSCDVTQSSHGYIGLLPDEPSQEGQRIRALHQYEPGVSKAGPTPVDSQNLYLEELYPQVQDVLNTQKAISVDAGQYGLHSVLIMPIILKYKVIGLLILRREDGLTYSSTQQDLLERVVSRAAVSIENARLYAAVQAADYAKTEFVGIVAHDLKAPMTSIRGYSDLLLMQPDNLDERQIQFLERISNTVKRMEILVSDLADLSRIESGQFLMDEMRVPLEFALEALRDTTGQQIQARQHQYTEEIAANLPDLWTDYYRLVQVLTNLMTNAYKYTPDGGHIRLSITPDGDRVRFTISDTGIGISPQDLAMLGTKFWRAEDSHTRSQPGTGLGFAITSSLVAQMGSAIEIHSRVGEGSTFSFTVATAS